MTSLAGWRRYHAEDARLWERQALTKLRPVAGDRALGAEVAAARRRRPCTAARPPMPRAVADEIMTMRDRIERELGSGGAISRPARAA